MIRLTLADTIRAYGNNPAFKAAFLAEITAHERADALLKGTYGDFDPTFKGCAIGCAVHSLYRLQYPETDPYAIDYCAHNKVAADLGWPLWLAYLEDQLFEALPNELSQTWPRRLTEAVPVGAVIDDAVLAKILVWSLTAERFGVIHAATDAKDWITTVADLATTKAAKAAGDAKAAWDARAAWNARDTKAARAAWNAWAAWVTKVTWDAWPARAARAADTRDQFYPALSDYVLSVLRELPAGAQQ